MLFRATLKAKDGMPEVPRDKDARSEGRANLHDERIVGHASSAGLLDDYAHLTEECVGAQPCPNIRWRAARPRITEGRVRRPLRVPSGTATRVSTECNRACEDNADASRSKRKRALYWPMANESMMHRVAVAGATRAACGAVTGTRYDTTVHRMQSRGHEGYGYHATHDRAYASR
eukprot:6909595-Prymnesium_polylepis.1